MIDLTDRSHCFYWQTDRHLSAEDFARIFLRRHEIDTEELVRILKMGIHSISGDKEIEIETSDENVIKGNVNIVRKIKINGQPFVARMHPKGVRNGYFYAEKLVLELAKTNGLPVPKVIEVHKAESSDDMDFMLMTVCSGKTMDVYLAQNKSVEDQLLLDCGRKMAHIHAIKVEGFGPFDNDKAKQRELVGLHSNYHDFTHTGLAENLQRLIQFDILSQSESEQMKQIFAEKNFEPIDGPRLVHNDFADWNLLTDGKTITGILDWDECHAGDPIADLACWSTFFTMQRFEQFLKGYTEVAKLTDEYEERFHFYRLRYTISKMALRVKRFQVDKDPGLQERLRVGKIALEEETSFFGIK